MTLTEFLIPLILVAIGGLVSLTLRLTLGVSDAKQDKLKERHPKDAGADADGQTQSRLGQEAWKGTGSQAAAKPNYQH